MFFLQNGRVDGGWTISQGWIFPRIQKTRHWLGRRGIAEKNNLIHSLFLRCYLFLINKCLKLLHCCLICYYLQSIVSLWCRDFPCSLKYSIPRIPAILRFGLHKGFSYKPNKLWPTQWACYTSVLGPLKF